MSTDRELLDLAAKAAGVVLEDEHYWRDGFWTRWNPLKDDGDALRLAVRLGLDIMFNPEDVEVIGHQHAKEDGGEMVAPWAFESWTLKQQDTYTATRRAIVRAAAEIGRTTPAAPPAERLSG